MVKNVKEEAGNVATSIGKSVAGIDENKAKTPEERQQTSEIMSDAVSAQNPSNQLPLGLDSCYFVIVSENDCE